MMGNTSTTVRSRPRAVARRSLTATMLALTIAGGLAACTSAEPTGNASSFAEVSGSAVPVADDLTALCAQIVEQQLDADTATALAEGSGYQSRVITIDGEAQAVTKDLRDDRMNFELTGGVVTACTVG